jgi:arsenite methyltransferase
MSKVNYGIDAPGIMRNLIVFRALTVVAGFAIPMLSDNTILKYISYLIVLVGAVFFILGIAMFAYGLKGKYRTRDLMLSKIKWTGKGNVLDIGTGQGLLICCRETDLVKQISLFVFFVVQPHLFCF